MRSSSSTEGAATLSKGDPWGPELVLSSLPAKPSVNLLGLLFDLPPTPHGLAMGRRPNPLFSVLASCLAFPIPKILFLQREHQHNVSLPSLLLTQGAQHRLLSWAPQRPEALTAGWV